MKVSAPTLLSFNGGFVDTAGYLALQGLFAAHVTGNFVTFGASLVQGASGAVAKLLALPGFCLVIILARLLRYRLMSLRMPLFETLIVLQLILLVVAATLAIAYGPFADGDSTTAIATGMTLVAAMAIQNAVHRVGALGALAILWLNMFAFIIPPIVSFASFIAPRQTLRGFQRSVHRWSKVRP
jgi:uncharacterized membrane protein YoaK (UPF0700 family)